MGLEDEREIVGERGEREWGERGEREGRKWGEREWGERGVG